MKMPSFTGQQLEPNKLTDNSNYGNFILVLALQIVYLCLDTRILDTSKHSTCLYYFLY